MSSFFEGISKRVSEGVNAMQSNLKKNNCCTSCSIAFSLTRSKKFCCNCKEPYCSSCIFRKPDNNERRCKRCVIFSRNELVWDELMQLRVKDLIWFLNRQNISSQGLKEKEQLAELILDYYGNEEYHRRRVTRERKIAERLMEEEPNASQTAPLRNQNETHSQPTPGTSHHPVAEHMDIDQPSLQSLPVLPDPEMPIAAPDIPPPPYNSTEEVSHPPQAAESVDIRETPGTSQPATVRNEIVEEKPAAVLLKGGTERVPLDELESEFEVELLTVKQLKDLLASNFVDYKGCVERQELLIRAKRLWRSHYAARQNCGESNNAAVAASSHVELNECRICMDDVINCVLLECGHMCTCVTCGKQLAECPICRQYVARVVRTFRS